VRDEPAAVQVTTTPGDQMTAASFDAIGAVDRAALLAIVFSGAPVVLGADGAATAVVLIVCLVAGMASPLAATAAVVLALPFTYRSVPIGGSVFSPLELAIGLLVASHGLSALRRGRTTGPPGRARLLTGIGLPVIVFLAAATVSLATVADPAHRHESLREYRLVIAEPILFYLSARLTLRMRHGRRVVAAALVAGGVVVAACAIAQLLLGLGVATDGVQRATVTYPHPNNLSFFLERVGTFAAGAALVLQRSRWRAIVAGSALIVFLGVGATLSRGAVVSVIVGVATLMLLTGRGRKVLVPSISMIGVIAILFTTLASGRLIDLGGSGRWPTRFFIWRSSLAMALDHPLWGVGLDQFLYLYWRRYVEPGGWPERYTSHPHNLFLDLWLRVGILGAGAFAWVCTRGAHLARRSLSSGGLPAMPYVAGATAALVTGLAHGMVDNGFFLPDVALMTWLFVAWLDAASHDRPNA
jgi:putative inorganic carbon (HCO3(-)) transporter